jgi:membrane protease YdiL (CAAX protease family)
MAGFLFASLAAWLATGPLMGVIGGLLGDTSQGRTGIAIYATVFLLLLLAVTWLALRWDGESLAAVGLTLDSRRGLEFACGFVATSVLFAGVALMRASSVEATWHFSGAGAFQAAVIGVPVAFVLMASEELVFRGYGFRQLVVACGPRAAVVASALVFGIYHLAQTGFRFWGIGAFWVIALPALGGLVFGVAMIRTNGLALPLGLHLGGNWVQASVLSFAPLGDGQPTALFVAPLTSTQAQQLWSPDLLPRAPYLVAMAVAGLLVALWPLSKRGAAGARPATA